MQGNRELWVEVLEDWSCGERSLEFVEGFLLGFVPQELLGFLEKVRKGQDDT